MDRMISGGRVRMGQASTAGLSAAHNASKWEEVKPFNKHEPPVAGVFCIVLWWGEAGSRHIRGGFIWAVACSGSGDANFEGL